MENFKLFDLFFVASYAYLEAATPMQHLVKNTRSQLEIGHFYLSELNPLNLVACLRTWNIWEDMLANQPGHAGTFLEC